MPSEVDDLVTILGERGRLAPSGYVASGGAWAGAIAGQRRIACSAIGESRELLVPLSTVTESCPVTASGGPGDPLDGSPSGVIGSVAAQDGAEGLEAEPREVVAGVDGGVAERFEEVALACPTRQCNDR